MPVDAGAADPWSDIGALPPIIWLGALVVCVLVLRGLSPVFGNFAVAVPTQRSSHTAPTPQWGGLGICAGAFASIVIAIMASGIFAPEVQNQVMIVVIAALMLMALGAVDDLRHLGAASKFGVQALAVAIMLTALPDEFRALPMVPLWLERGLLFFGALWFVNLVNFMDGIDWMMVAEVVPVTAGVAIVGALGALPPEALVVALALNGAMLGFAPFNRPIARLFMGDTGSLPIGLLLAWLLIVVAASGHHVAALLLPLYFIADTGVTLLRRAYSGERLWVAHRTHFYQRARDNGFTTMGIVARVFAVNAGLVALAALSVIATSRVSHGLALLGGVCLVGGLMVDFARPRSK